MKIGFEYIKYRWNAKGRHGIHSPFVYDFIDKCQKIEFSKKNQSYLQTIFKKLKNDSRIIEIEDFGAGSKKLSNQRKISTIFKTSSSKGKYGQLLFQLSKYYQFKNCLEFGTSLGIGSMHLSLGNPNTKITTIEACENTRKIALENLSSFENIESIHATFDQYLAEKDSETLFDFVFIDGHHDGEALLHYMEELRSCTTDETLFVLDDIRWSDSMLNAWNKIKNDPEYHLSIDLFRVGMVARRTKQEKEEFVMKI